MSDCGVCIGVEDCDGYSDFTSRETPRARKAHRCCECRTAIVPGQSYVRDSGKFDGDFYSEKTCLPCAEIRDCFCCGNGFVFGELWEQMRDYVFPEIALGCTERVSTVEAKALIRQRWLEWKGIPA